MTDDERDQAIREALDLIGEPLPNGRVRIHQDTCRAFLEPGWDRAEHYRELAERIEREACLPDDLGEESDTVGDDEIPDPAGAS